VTTIAGLTLSATVTWTPVEQLFVLLDSPATGSTQAPIQNVPVCEIETLALSADVEPADKLDTGSDPMFESPASIVELVEYL